MISQFIYHRPSRFEFVCPAEYERKYPHLLRRTSSPRVEGVRSCVVSDTRGHLQQGKALRGEVCSAQAANRPPRLAFRDTSKCVIVTGVYIPTPYPLHGRGGRDSRSFERSFDNCSRKLHGTELSHRWACRVTAVLDCYRTYRRIAPLVKVQQREISPLQLSHGLGLIVRFVTVFSLNNHQEIGVTGVF